MFRGLTSWARLWVMIVLAATVAATAFLGFAGLTQVYAETAPSFRPSTEPVKHELTAVIDAQLAAFRADDYAKAYTFASATIKEAFPASGFETMVRTAYPVIAKSVRADYGLAFDTGEEAVVNVRLESSDHRGGEFQYQLKKENGAWKITGVSELKPEGLAV